nr:O-antigen ligase family protein [uncultured Mucilaginibacter sp.]
MIIIGLSDERMSFVEKFTKPLNFIVINALMCITTYACLSAKSNYLKIYKTLLIFMSAACLYALFNMVTKSNPYNTDISQKYRLTDFAFNYMHSDDGRFRISSFMYHPFYFAIFSYFMILFGLFFYTEKNAIKFNRTVLLALLILFCLVLVFTDSRTVQILFVGSVVIYLFVLTSNLKRSITATLIAPVVIALVMQIPAVSGYVDKLSDIFLTGGEKVEGSNVNMRAEQLAVSTVYFIKSPIVGNGFDYITETIGYASDKNKSRSDEAAYGFESYFYTIIIEQGILGVLAHIVLFYALIKYHIKNAYSTNGRLRNFIFINLLIIVGYIVFIMATGTLNTMPLFFTLVGISISLQEKELFNKKTI